VTLEELGRQLLLKVHTAAGKLRTEVTGGYAADLLSCVMAKAQAGNVWVTLQGHPNIVAVASLLNLAGVIITEGMAPDPATLEKAEEQVRKPMDGQGESRVIESPNLADWSHVCVS